jgi:WD40 repeat protein
MSKKTKVPTYRFPYFQLQAPLPLARDRWARHWWIDNAHHYRLVASITAEHELQALTLLEDDSWYRHPEVELLTRVSSLRPRAYGDVLLCKGMLGYWKPMMVQGETLVELSQVQETSPVEHWSHQKAILAVAWSPDGMHYAACGKQGLVQIYTPGSQRNAAYNTHAAYAQALAWSPDGRYIATGDCQDAVHVWEAAITHGLSGSGAADVGRILVCREYRHADLYQGVYALAWSPDSRYVASGNHLGELHIWDARTGECVFVDRRQGEGSVMQALAWSSDGTRLASAYDAGVVLLWNWSVVQGCPARGTCTFHAMTTTGLGPIRSLAWSPDDTKLLIGAGENPTLALYDGFPYRSESGIERRDIPLSVYSDVMGVGAVAFSPDGSHIVAGCADGVVQVVHLGSGDEHIYSYFGHREAVNAVAWSPNGTFILSGSDDAYVRLWDAGLALKDCERGDLVQPEPTLEAPGALPTG